MDITIGNLNASNAQISGKAKFSQYVPVTYEITDERLEPQQQGLYH